MNKKILAAIVTRDRLENLKITISAVLNQTRKPNEILVINNDSTDGTKEWLEQQSGLTIINQENLGSSGGQFTAFSYSIEKNFDWIWVLEDDIIPNPDCLELLLENSNENTILAPLLLEKDLKPFYHFALDYNLTNPFKSFWNGIIDENHVKQQYIDAIGITFEGPLVHRKVIEMIGLPERKFFIFADDTEYFIRASKAGFNIIVVTKANCIRQFDYYELKEFTWKQYFIIRNLIAVSVLHGNKSVRYIRPFIFLFKWLFKSRKPADFKLTFKAFWDGFNYKSNH
jgi:GT2 family glycosyltransferase